MNRPSLFLGATLFAFVAASTPARADGTREPDAAIANPPTGFAVLAEGNASSVAWPFARGLYATELRPGSLDDVHARVLAGEAPPPGAAQDVKDLAETRAAIHGDDAPSRALLANVANALALRGIVVVRMASEANPSSARAPSARVYLADVHRFDAAQYAPDVPAPSAIAESGDAADAGIPSGPTPRWDGAVESLVRAYGAPDAHVGSKAPMSPFTIVAGAKNDRSVARPFYTSPWFWGAVGAAVFAGGAIYFATRDNSPSTIHLQVQVP